MKGDLFKDLKASWTVKKEWQAEIRADKKVKGSKLKKTPKHHTKNRRGSTSQEAGRSQVR